MSAAKYPCVRYPTQSESAPRSATHCAVVPDTAATNARPADTPPASAERVSTVQARVPDGAIPHKPLVSPRQPGVPPQRKRNEGNSRTRRGAPYSVGTLENL